ncbi:hypothetical protein VMCG_10225 [Cytospora schulzeri]|uniref:Uncharacterized protein n=1 Tax=Cytospora schulzeri TaxID=448051 RepID=A0A423VEQ3_9PEZI|nr:hypothetical protein VMCG_10225 [Valsa malicola]
MRLITFASIVGLFGLGSCLPFPPINSTISSVNITQSNTTSVVHTLPLDIPGDDFDDLLSALLPSLEQYEAIVHAYNKTGLVRRSNPGLRRGHKLADEVENGLPECWQTCFKNDDGKAGNNSILEM